MLDGVMNRKGGEVREVGRSESASLRVLRRVKKPLHNLPAQLTPLIGREREIVVLREILLRPDVRLLSLIGPGGVGKSRLGLWTASSLVKDFADGVCLVSLAPIVNPELVVPTVARTLGLKESGARPLFERLEEHLQDKQLLLVLDNFEQVLGAAPGIAELLSACPELKVLATSREALRVSGEQEFPVSPLEAPGPGHLDAEKVAGYPAVELFARRAQAVRPDFEVTGTNAVQVAQICHRLDGLPLAIELAAARIRLLPPETMLARLELRILTGGARDAPARQKTLKSTIEWSYNLLEGGEQRLFRHLAVFVGGAVLWRLPRRWLVSRRPWTLWRR